MGRRVSLVGLFATLAGQGRALQLHTNRPTAVWSMSQRGGLFDVFTRLSATDKSGILTPKSRVGLGDLSISPIGEISIAGLGAYVRSSDHRVQLPHLEDGFMLTTDVARRRHYDPLLGCALDSSRIIRCIYSLFINGGYIDLALLSAVY